MERDGGFNRSQKKHAKQGESSVASDSAFGTDARRSSVDLMSFMQGKNVSNNHANAFPNAPPRGTNAAANNNNLNLAMVRAPQQPPPCTVREQDQYMPIANVTRIMRRIIPPYAKISDDAKETIQECVSEFISFITGEANERCQREQRKTVTAEDVLCAMRKLGFDQYVEPLTRYLERYREAENEYPTTRDPIPKRTPANSENVGMMMPPIVPPSLTMGDGQGMYSPTTAALLAGYYFRDVSGDDGGSDGGGGSGGSGGSSSSYNEFSNNGPFMYFKQEDYQKDGK